MSRKEICLSEEQEICCVWWDLCTHLNSAPARHAEDVIYVKLKTCLRDWCLKLVPKWIYRYSWKDLLTEEIHVEFKWRIQVFKMKILWVSCQKSHNNAFHNGNYAVSIFLFFFSPPLPPIAFGGFICWWIAAYLFRDSTDHHSQLILVSANL